MGNISRNFNREEFKCNCGCEPIAVDAELVKVLQSIRDQFNKSIKITSSYRCKAYNEHIGGAEKSKHVLGIAADIQVSGLDARYIAKYLDEKYPHKYGVGSYETFTHIDVRKIKARWVK